MGQTLADGQDCDPTLRAPHNDSQGVHSWGREEEGDNGDAASV